jgi:hypothetical protein
MATYQYNGTDAREFPTLAITVKPGDTFESQDVVISADVTLASAPKTKTTTPSAPSDTTVGE